MAFHDRNFYEKLLLNSVKVLKLVYKNNINKSVAKFSVNTQISVENYDNESVVKFNESTEISI